MFRIRRNRILIYMGGLALGLAVFSLWMLWEKGREAEADCMDYPVKYGPTVYRCNGGPITLSSTTSSGEDCVEAGQLALW